MNSLDSCWLPLVGQWLRRRVKVDQNPSAVALFEVVSDFGLILQTK
jgi:hypothetical protein